MTSTIKMTTTEMPEALGSLFLPWARSTSADRLATWEAWETLSNAAQGEPKKITTQ